MKTIGTALRDIVSGLDVFEQDQAKKDLLDLKKQIAQEVVEKFQKQNADFIVSLSNELIVDYLVDEGGMDKLHDALVEKGLDVLTQHAPKLVELREQLNTAKTEAELKTLQANILDQSPNQHSASSSTDITPVSPKSENGLTIHDTPPKSSVIPTPISTPHPDELTNSEKDSSKQEKTTTEKIQEWYQDLEGMEKPDFEPFSYAMQGYEKLKGSLKNDKYLTVVDYSKSNKENRFFVINMETKSVEYALPVGHGKKSGGEFAKSFSDKHGSNQSSLGFYRTPKSITKSNTKSWSGLLLQGIEESNDNAKQRGIYIHPGSVKGSEGCFTLPTKASQVMKKIKGDSLLFAYYPDQEYLASSDVLQKEPEYYA